jgi:hypothetical protein
MMALMMIPNDGSRSDSEMQRSGMQQVHENDEFKFGSVIASFSMTLRVFRASGDSERRACVVRSAVGAALTRAGSVAVSQCRSVNRRHGSGSTHA